MNPVKVSLVAIRRTLLLVILASVPFNRVRVADLPYTEISLVLIYLFILVHIPTLTKTLASKWIIKYLGPSAALIALLLIQSMMFSEHDSPRVYSELRQHMLYLVFFILSIQTVRKMARANIRLKQACLVAAIIPAIALLSGLGSTIQSSGRTTFMSLNPNLLSQYFVLGLLIALDIIYSRHRLIQPAALEKMILSVLLLMLLMALAMTGSRSGVVILVCSVTIFFALRKNASAREIAGTLSIGVFCIGVLFIFLIDSPLFMQRMESVGDDIRFQVLWPLAYEIFIEHPIFGAGLAELDQRLSLETGREIMVHNEILRIAAGAGMLGIGALFWFLGTLFKDALEARRRSGSASALCVLSAAIMYLAQGGTLYSMMPWIAFILVVSESRTESRRLRAKRAKSAHNSPQFI